MWGGVLRWLRADRVSNCENQLYVIVIAHSASWLLGTVLLCNFSGHCMAQHLLKPPICSNERHPHKA